MIPANIQSIKMLSVTFALSAIAAVSGGAYVLHETSDNFLATLTLSGLLSLPLVLKGVLTKGQSCTQEMLDDTEELLKLESIISPAGTFAVVGGITAIQGEFDPYAVSFTINVVAAMVMAKYLIHQKNRQCSLLENTPR